MEFEVSYDLENAEQFWDELDDIVAARCDSSETIDNALRNWLGFTAKYKEEYLQSEYDLARSVVKLLQSPIFTSNKEYVRRQIVYGLLQEDDTLSLHLIAAFLLFDGRDNEQTFEMMLEEGVFPRLVELVQHGGKDDVQLHQMLLVLLYEMSRIQRLTWNDLMAVDDDFILYLFQIIEQMSGDVNDPYHYLLIRVLLVLNEQYLVISTATSHNTTNRVIKALSTHGSVYKTFGENIILRLNRETETSVQLLILKLLYLLFSTTSTAEYFYTNDLHVLLDVIMRNLLDLPSDNASALALRHTYLRVLCPLLANSQLRREGMGYKRDDIRQLLKALGEDANSGEGKHFAAVDPTTARLVSRCIEVPWLKEAEKEEEIEPAEEQELESPNDTEKDTGDGSKEIAKKMLGMSLKEANTSATSVIAVAAHKERPGVKTPSKHKQEAEEDD